MGPCRKSCVIYTLALWALVGPAASLAFADGPLPDPLVRKLAEHAGAERGQVVPITEDFLARIFSRHFVFALRFRQYPVALVPPDPLESNNLFVVKPDGSVEHI